jgi:hypothetical protein
MNKAFSALLPLLTIFSLTIVSCEKAGVAPDTSEVSVAESALATEISSDLFLELSGFFADSRDMFAASEEGFEIMDAENTTSSCIEVTITPQDNTWPKTVTINFGAGCTAGEVTRKGKMIAVLSHSFQNTGARITLTFENFEINGRKLEGTQIITNNGPDAAGFISFTHEIPSLRISTADKAISFSSTNTIEWIEGSSTAAPADDVFAISGQSSGLNSGGGAFSAEIITPLIRKVACSYIVSGSSLIKSGDSQVTMDYGTGDCDDKAVLNTAGEIKEITLAAR